MKEISISVAGLGTVGSQVIKSIENKSYEINSRTNPIKLGKSCRLY